MARWKVSQECSESLDNIKPKAKNNKDGQKRGQETGNEKVSSQAGSNIYTIIHSPHVLLQKSTVPPKDKDTVNKIKHKVKRKKSPVKQVSPVMDANFYQTLLYKPHHSLIK